MIFFQQTDAAPSCNAASLCSGAALASASVRALASVGGTPGSLTKTVNLAASTATVMGIQFEIDTTGYMLLAGTWTIRLNVTTASTRSATIKAIYICLVSGSGTCTNKATIGSATGLSIALNSTGVKTQNVTGSAVTLAEGDHIEIQICVANGSSSKTDTFSFRSNQTIDASLDYAVTTDWQQTDTVATFADDAWCAGGTVDRNPNHQAVVGGLSGSTPYFPSVGIGARTIGFMELDPSGYRCPAGNWVVQMDVSTAAMQATTQITGCYVCLVDSSGLAKRTIASVTGLSIPLNSTGLKTIFLAGADMTSDMVDGDYIEVQLTISTTVADGWGVRPDGIIGAPLALTTQDTSWQQTDTLGGSCRAVQACSDVVNLGHPGTRAAIGGIAGSSTNTSPAFGSGTHGLSIAEIDPTGYRADAGAWVVRLNVTGAAVNARIVACFICQVDSTCAVKAMIASVTNLWLPLTPPGVKTITLRGVAANFAVGDMIEVIVCINATVATEYIQFVHDQIIGASLVLSGATYNVDTSLRVTMAETPALALARAGALTLGATLAQSDVSKLDAVGRSTMSTTLTCTPATQRNAVGAATLSATFSCSSAAPVAGTIYDVSAGTMTMTFGHAAVTQRAAVGATSLGASFSCSSAMLRTTAGAITLPATLSHSTATQRNAVGSTTLPMTCGFADNGGASYLVTAGTMGVTMSESSAVWTARQGAATLSVTMSAQASSQGNVTSSATFSVHPTISPASSANIFSATALPTSFGFSTSSAVAAATYDKATSFAFTASLSAPQPRLDAAGRATLAATLSEMAASRANRMAGATLPVVPGLTAATALPVQAVSTLAALFGLSAEGIENLATVIEQLRLDALKAGAQLSTRKPGADLSAGRGRTDLEAMKETTDLDARKDEDSLGGEL